jgi:hypothetical protein
MSTKTLEELQREKVRIEREIAEQGMRARDEEQRKARLATQTFEEATGVHVGCSDDYATLTLGCYGPVYRRPEPNTSTKFYFGYEHTVCPVHGSDTEACHEADCNESEWAFVVKEQGKETMRLGASQLHPKLGYDEPAESLLCGIGLWIEQQRKATPPQRTL